MLTRKRSCAISDSALHKRQPCLVSKDIKQVFRPLTKILSEKNINHKICSYTTGEEHPPSTLKLVQIYFDTATFDEIERDAKVNFATAMSLIGGTMGLLTGFSIISGIEIIFFLFKFITSFLRKYLN